MPQGQCRLDRATPAPIKFRATRVAKKITRPSPIPFLTLPSGIHGGLVEYLTLCD